MVPDTSSYLRTTTVATVMSVFQNKNQKFQIFLRCSSTGWRLKLARKSTRCVPTMAASTRVKHFQAGWKAEGFVARPVWRKLRSRTVLPKDRIEPSLNEPDLCCTRLDSHVSRSWSSGRRRQTVPSTYGIECWGRRWKEKHLTKPGQEGSRISHTSGFLDVRYAHIPRDERTKFAPRAVKCILVGYCETHKGFRLWDPVSRRVQISRDVRFNEEILSLINRSPLPDLPSTVEDDIVSPDGISSAADPSLSPKTKETESASQPAQAVA